MLVLFDIDGTLLRTHGAGLTAMLATAHELHPGRTFNFAGISISGRLDTLIWRDLMASGGLDYAKTDHDAFRARYGIHLAAGFDSDSKSEALPGARDLVLALDQVVGCTLGLLTGNYEHTGRLKVERAGIETKPFVCNAWADDGNHRRELPPIAMARYQATIGAIDPDCVFVIGDTPFDIDCAKANGCVAIAVATGAHPRAELAEHHPDLLVDDLSATEDLALWMTGRKRR